MIKKIRIARTGNEVAAEAMRQINPDVVAAYPITPATEIVQLFSNFVADGQVKTEFVAVESEHSALSAVLGASAAGARAMTATSSQGLALMHEILYIVSGLRLPVVMTVVNRALSAPINIHCDHSDTMGSREAGWIQLFSENTQEVYDNLLQAVRIAENAYLPVMVTMDGFIISHALEAIDILPDEEVGKYLGEFKPLYNLLDANKPVTVGPLDFTDFFFEHKRGQIEAMRQSLSIIKDISQDFSARYGGNYELFEGVNLEDAEIILVVLGSSAGTIKAILPQLRAKGLKVGLLKLRVYRPFPEKELSKILNRAKVIGVLDRSDSLSGVGGPLYNDVRAALYRQQTEPVVVDFVYGLGGRDFLPEHIFQIVGYLGQIKETGNIPQSVVYAGVRGDEIPLPASARK